MLYLTDGETEAQRGNPRTVWRAEAGSLGSQAPRTLPSLLKTSPGPMGACPQFGRDDELMNSPNAVCFSS